MGVCKVLLVFLNNERQEQKKAIKLLVPTEKVRITFLYREMVLFFLMISFNWGLLRGIGFQK
ncbi:hypothetical protein RHMOL_Rhmol08G0050400 [Rhododendron molle]|uniref:Uncharacterized protein n=1 Tax=Rhododendron molle TaxID=49168 RepID=A0ACC0MKL3_RHOML|nr:hypothetical protein RHMOL_Rhmol08G0050400 [Rhododendron molle]